MVRPTGAQVETMVTRYTLLGIEIHDELQMCKITKCRVQALYKYIYIVVETQLLWFCFYHTVNKVNGIHTSSDSGDSCL